MDARAIEKYEREAKNKNRESWFLAFILDTTEEERTKGITVEVRHTRLLPLRDSETAVGCRLAVLHSKRRISGSPFLTRRGIKTMCQI